MAEERIGLRSKRKQDWFWLENELIDNIDLTIYEKMVYITLVRSCNNDTSTCFPSIHIIANKSGCSERQVKRVIKTLEEKDLIKKISRKIPGAKEFDSNLYYVYSIKDSKVATDSHNSGNCESHQVVTDSHNGGDCESHQVVTDRHSNNSNINKTNIYIDLGFLNMDIENVFLTEIEYKKLIGRYDESYIKELIVSLENYIVNGKGKKYKSHYKTLLAWAAKDPKAPKSKVVIVNDEHQLKRIGIDDSKISKLS